MAKQRVVLKPKQRERLINNLVTNCDCEQTGPWSELDRELLSNTSDERLVELERKRQRMAANELVTNAVLEGIELDNEHVLTFNAEEGQFEVNAFTAAPDGGQRPMPVATGSDDPEVAAEGEVGDTGGKPKARPGTKPTGEMQMQAPQQVGNTHMGQAQVGNAGKPVTLKQWMNDPTVPAEVKQIVANATQAQTAVKGRMIQAILNSPRAAAAGFTKDSLAVLNVEQLRPIINMLGGQQLPSYAGAAGGPDTGASPISNEDDDDDDTYIPQTINWEKESENRNKKLAKQG